MGSEERQQGKMPDFRYSVGVSTKKKPEDPNRLQRLEQLMEKQDRRGSRLSWIRWNPNSKYGYEIEDAREDIRWMVYEIKKLREENTELKSFVDNFRESMEEQIGRDSQ